MQFSLENVDGYFENHLDRAEWDTFSDDEKTAAITMAERDASCELNRTNLDTENHFIFCAVCEQALYLALNRHRRTDEEEAGRNLFSERVQGVGSRSYRPAARPAASGDCPRERWSARAWQYLLRAENTIPAIGRG